LIDLGDNKVFADAPDLYPAIHIVEKTAPPAYYETQAAIFNRNEGLDDFDRALYQKIVKISVLDQRDSAWQLENDSQRDLFKKLAKGRSLLSDVALGNIFYGVKTGLNEVFIISEETRDKLIKIDPRSEQIIKPFLSGTDLRPYYQSFQNQWIIFSRRGINIQEYPAVYNYLLMYKEVLEPKPKNFPLGENWKGRKPGSYQWYELQDSVDYFIEFSKPKIMWPDITKFPRFSWDETGYYLGNTGYILVTEDKWLLAYLNSRCAWYLISKLSIALGERAGLQRYRLIDQYMRPLPVPTVSDPEKIKLTQLAELLTNVANKRFRLHSETRHRIISDLGSPITRLNEKLSNWWELDFQEFRTETKRVFRRDIPLKERTDWEYFLDDARQSHETYTVEIVRMETELNAIVYELFDLTALEINIIEQSTKYKYGEF
jgi:hypothetical protein